MSKPNTLFNYFSKKSSSTPDTKAPKKEESSKSNDDEHKLGDLVWAWLDGYPWWPSMICNHPTQNKHTEGKGDRLKIHVQFFDDPVSRGWVKAKSVAPYKGSEDKAYAERGGQFYSSDAQCLKGAKQADEAMAMSHKDRLSTFLVELLSTDESEEEEVVPEPMEFNDDIFDKEESEGSGKENAEVDVNANKNKRSPSKTPKKTPAKRARRAVKRRRIIESGDEGDSEDEFKPKKGEASSSEESSGEESENLTTATESEIDSPVKGVKRSRPGSNRAKPKRKSGGPRIQRAANSDTESDHDSPKSPKQSPKKSPKSPTKLAAFSRKTSEDKDEEMEVDATPSKESEKTDEKKKSGVSSFFSPSREKSDATPKRSFTPSVADKTKNKLAAFAANDTVAGPSTEEGRSFLHNAFPHLQPDKIKDGEKRRPDHPDYDPRTLYVPAEFLNKQTPGMRQWWDLKSRYFDVVLFFKMGKFYELFHMDADVGVNELGLIYMKGDHAHAGFPEIAYGRYADTLVQKGYKVARIEQTETPEMNAERCKNMGRVATKFDKVVRREVCNIQTKGTKRYSFLDGDASDSANAYLLALAEKEAVEVGEGSIYGVCFVDTSIGKFHVGQFTDDRHCSRLRTLVSHYPPAQILSERGRISEKTQAVITNSLPGVLREILVPGKEFWDSKKTLKTLSESDYFVDEKDAEKGVQWPEAIKAMMDEGDNLGQTAKSDCDLAVSAVGAITWYLQKCLVDQELFSMRNFEEYQPVDNPSGSTSQKAATGQRHMVLDGVTLANLEILENMNGGREGTLLERLDMCSTPFGHRLFKQWLCAPLYAASAIEERLDAVEDLIENPDVVADTIELLKKLPDLERLLSKIHTLGSGTRKENHPDGRAIMYEEVNYGKKKIEDFIATLAGFKLAQDIAKKFKPIAENCKSRLLKQVVTIGNDKEARFPDLSEQLKYFDAAFDHKKARAEGTIKPKAGMDPEYDEALADIARNKERLDDYLSKQKQRLGCKTLSYWGTGKNRYQLEVPESVAKNVPDSYEVTSQRKGFRRYRTREIEDAFGALTEAEERKDEAVRDCLRRCFFAFDKSYSSWERCVQCLSLLDVLISLSQYSKCGDGGTMCRPKLGAEREGRAYLELREARHPCVAKTYSGADFIPNDTLIGCGEEDESESKSLVVLVTGPNMGGKSTLMRQVGTIVIMAQLGCYVPAEVCSLTPVDRVFTRLGASDRIMAGESTFFVELSETAAILQHATPASLVLMDELGRGTATYDGTAIACAVVRELSGPRLSCRSLFSTHYHSLVHHFSHDDNVRTGHMACMVENENEDDPTQETITFLYKFTGGACPKSYGFNAAQLANLPDEIIKTARHKAAEFEANVERLRFFRELNATADLSKLKEIQGAINL